jgi:DNA-3-methyladenine glycosylase I
METTDMKRCSWVSDDTHIKYHDTEWGVPLHNDRKLFEFLILDGMQSGLSWKIILNKRSSFKKAFDNFDPNKISSYKKNDVERLMSNEGIIRNKRKIESVINNAKRYLEVKKEFKTFDLYIWSFVNYKTKKNKYKKWIDIPTASKESKKMSIDMKKRGFLFIGPVVCYAFMQTIGLVNDHLITCFRHNEINNI